MPAKKAAAKAAAESKEPPIDEALDTQAKVDVAIVEADKLSDPDDAARAALDAARDAYRAAQLALLAARDTVIQVIPDELVDVPLPVFAAAVKDVVNAVGTYRAALDTYTAARDALDTGDYPAAQDALVAARPAYLAARAAQVADHPKKGK